MYKHLTPQEIEEFEKEFEYADFPINLAGTRSNIRILSFIDTLIGKRVGDIDAFLKNVLRGVDIADREMGNTHGGTKAIRMALISRGLLSPDSPKRNEE